MGLLWSADCFELQKEIGAALRAMTGPEWESAVMLFVIFIQLLKHSGVIRNWIFLNGNF